MGKICPIFKHYCMTHMCIAWRENKKGKRVGKCVALKCDIFKEDLK